MYVNGTEHKRSSQRLPMFRCHFTQGGRIVQGADLDSLTLEDAIAESQRLLAEKSLKDALDGLEIWCRARLLHTIRR
jgi:hypothetical protein